MAQHLELFFSSAALLFQVPVKAFIWESGKKLMKKPAGLLHWALFALSPVFCRTGNKCLRLLVSQFMKVMLEGI